MFQRVAAAALVAAVCLGNHFSWGADPLPAVVPAAGRLVTLRAKAVPVKQLLAQVAAQTHIIVKLDAPQNPKLAVQINQVAFWKALDQIADKADMHVAIRGENKIVLAQGKRQVPTSYKRPFRMQLTRITTSRDLETASTECQVRLLAAWEPTFQPFLVELNPASLVVEDQQGKALPVPAQGGVRVSVLDKPYFETDLLVPLLPRPAVSYGKIKGSLSVLGARQMLLFSINAPATGSKAAQQGVELILSQVKIAKELWTVEVTLNYPANGPRFDSFESWLLKNKIYLLSRDGKVRLLARDQPEVLTQTSNHAVIRYYFPDKALWGTQPENWKVVYFTPGPIAELTVPFEFRDVPLP